MEKKTLFSILFLAALIIVGLSFAQISGIGNMDLLNRYYIKNATNVDTTNLTIKNPPSACPANTYMQYFTGKNSTCTAVSQVTNNVNMSNNNLSVQCIVLTSGGSLCSAP